MKKHVFHLNKRFVCLGAAMVMVCAMVLTGCESTKKITSSALENEDTGSGDAAANEETKVEETATDYTLEVTVTRMDKGKLKVDKIADIDSNSDAFIVDAISSQTVYKQGDNDDTYMAYVDMTEEGAVIDYAFYSDADTDGMKYDAKAGTVSIPKSVCEAAKGGRLGIQLMVAVDNNQ